MTNCRFAPDKALIACSRASEFVCVQARNIYTVLLTLDKYSEPEFPQAILLAYIMP